MFTALGKAPELKLHIGGALTNGVTPDEIKESLLQTAIYCGAPAAVEAFRCAMRHPRPRLCPRPLRGLRP